MGATSDHWAAMRQGLYSNSEGKQPSKLPGYPTGCRNS